MSKSTLQVIKSITREYALKHIFNKAESALCEEFNRLNGVFFRSPINIYWESKYKTYRIVERETDTSRLEIHIARRRRIPLYLYGINVRLQSLARKYLVDRIELTNGDTVIDCGANVGELGKYLNVNGQLVDYHAIEPSKEEAKCIRLNLPSAVIEEKGLWKEKCRLALYEQNECADSSIIPIQEYDDIVEIEATTISSYAKSNDIRSIKLLKLEGEGAEPEILEGAVEMLDLIEWISADCGPERGESKEMTFKFVINFLLDNDFQVEALNPKKYVVLFKRRNHKK